MEDSNTPIDAESVDVAGVILTRGRHVDIRQYILKHPDELVKGVLVAGSIGSGKTQRAMQIILAALESGFGVLVFDPSGDHGRLASVYPDTVVLDFREFIINPLEPPQGMKMNEWIPTFIQVFAQNYGLKDPSIAILQKAVKNLMSNSSFSEEKPPILEELLEEVQQDEPRLRSSEVSSHVSVQNRLESLLDSEIGCSVNARRGFQPEDFESGLLVVQLPSSGITRAHELIVGITIAKLFAYRAWLKRRTDIADSKIFIVLEEAHNYLSETRRADRQGERSQLERALIEGRKLDIGFLIIDQMPQRISSHVLGSCNMWIVGRLLDPAAKNVIGDGLYLDAVWSRDGLMSLPTGGAFIRVEHMKELESDSPLEHWRNIDENTYWAARGLPAIVASPCPKDQLIQEISQSRILDLMVDNQRYMKYFIRYATERIEKIRSIAPEYVVKMLEQFLYRNVKRIDEEGLTFSECYGLSIEEIEAFSNREIKGTYKQPKMSTRSRIHDLEIRCQILSTEVTREVLTYLKTSKATSLHDLSLHMNKSRSWLSRILRELESRGFVSREVESCNGKKKYQVTAYGKELLLWAQVITDLQDIGVDKWEQRNIVTIDKHDFDWLMELLREEAEIQEYSYIAGWRGSEEIREFKRGLEYRAQILAGSKRINSELERHDSNPEILRRILSSLESHVLRVLLQSQKSIPIADLSSLCRISSRSIRRYIRILEDSGILLRQKESHGWSVSIRESWKQLLLDDCNPSKGSVRLTLNILNSLLVHAVDNALLELILEGSSDFDSIEFVVSKCLSIQNTIK